MPPPLLHGVTVKRLRGTKVPDGYGGEQIDWTNPAELTVAGCGMAPRVEDEQADRGRQGVIVGWTVYAPWSDITYDDRLETPHGLFAVDGEPGFWESPYTGRQPGMTIALRRVDG